MSKGTVSSQKDALTLLQKAATYDEAEADQDRIRAQLGDSEYERMVTEAKAKTSAAQAAIQAVHEALRAFPKVPSLPHSPTFPDTEIYRGYFCDGRHQYCKDFILALKWKFKYNASLFESEQHKLAYAVARTAKDARAVLHPYIAEDGTINLPDVDALFAKLLHHFRPDPWV